MCFKRLERPFAKVLSNVNFIYNPVYCEFKKVFSLQCSKNYGKSYVLSFQRLKNSVLHI
jgi:hypothetical protein